MVRICTKHITHKQLLNDTWPPKPPAYTYHRRISIQPFCAHPSLYGSFVRFIFQIIIIVPIDGCSRFTNYFCTTHVCKFAIFFCNFSRKITISQLKRKKMNVAAKQSEEGQLMFISLSKVFFKSYFTTRGYYTDSIHGWKRMWFDFVCWSSLNKIPVPDSVPIVIILYVTWNDFVLQKIFF